MKVLLLLVLLNLIYIIFVDANECDSLCNSARNSSNRGFTLNAGTLCGDLIRNGCYCDFCLDGEFDPLNQLRFTGDSPDKMKYKYFILLNDSAIATISDMPQFKSREMAKNYDAWNNTEFMNLSSWNVSVSVFKGGNTSLVLMNNSSHIRVSHNFDELIFCKNPLRFQSLEVPSNDNEKK